MQLYNKKQYQKGIRKKSKNFNLSKKHYLVNYELLTCPHFPRISRIYHNTTLVSHAFCRTFADIPVKLKFQCLTLK